jgi:hypothetical protein
MSLFDVYAIKKNGSTDKTKGAYVLSRQQEDVLLKAGLVPDPKRPAKIFQIEILGDESKKTINATYYHAIRVGAGRPGEPRLGREIISYWLQEGDELFLTTDGSTVFAAKLKKADNLDIQHEIINTELAPRLSDADVENKAKYAQKKAKKVKTTSISYVRNPYIIESAKRARKR